MGFTSYLFVEEKIKGLADSYEIPGSSSSGDWSQINSRLRPSISGDRLGEKKGEYFICLPEMAISGFPAPSVRAGEESVGSDTFLSDLAHVFHTYPQ